MQTWPKIENFPAQFCSFLANSRQLRILKLKIREVVLDKQLHCLTNRKIRHLEISGRNLKFVSRNAFTQFIKNPDLILVITGTRIEELPSGLFSHMNRISNLKIDLSNNMLTSLNPEIFYENITVWENIGTSMMSGKRDKKINRG